ncbi:MAG: 3-deoxy-D-manno-octulosonic acid kinase [Pseudomonadota bacterium]|nr:3-deoxy-D-manno-octulosonic acid kinase [Pseudomonadota bacterium]
MHELVRRNGSEWVLFDLDQWDGHRPALFERDVARTSVTGGRGDAWFVSHGDMTYVVRHYRRGGAIEALLSDRYVWSGIEATRAFREWRLLAMLVTDGLPVPRPVAARVSRSGWFYRADLVTRKLSGTVTLADRLIGGRLPGATWRAAGCCIRLFHDRGVYHSDLNAHNILLDENGRAYLIDFDKGEIRTGESGGWKEANLARLRRSLEKLADRSPGFCYEAGDFAALIGGYADAG